jgi:dolichyl-phosphate-mannose-protein mannosyltransferase
MLRFDELHYGKYVSLYMKKTFFFDSQPPLGKQLIATAAYFGGYTGLLSHIINLGHLSR